ncbi:MAG: aminodeoxychorismate synthase component I [Prochlorococcus sp. SP3034]|nr:aminodeoxychorismate synthase component I [Prochlorococcus sp. SP3034]
MKIHKIKINNWIEPEMLAKVFSQKYGNEGFSWLDSDGSETGEWSLLGVRPQTIISCRKGKKIKEKDNPFQKLQKIDQGFWMGWLSYEAGAWLEMKNKWQNNEIATLWIASYDPIIRINLINKEIFVEGSKLKEIDIYKKIIEDINTKELQKNEKLEFDFSEINLEKNFKVFQESIMKIKKLISIGDIFQANITTKCEIKAKKKYSFLDIYLKIRNELRAPFGGIIISNENNKEGVLSASPERFLKVDKSGFVETRPIKGTRPRSKDEKLDAFNAIDLITNEKDRAENIMIVDLLRNDLSKVCETGSIIVPELLKLESYSKVHHLTSVIRGKLKKEKNWIDLLMACWPGGSITGAPKIRSCQRLFEIEGFERGPYCGSFIKIDWNGEFDSNILIRSFILKNKSIKVYAGCGIVYDSDPTEENEEMKWKLLPLINSLK